MIRCKQTSVANPEVGIKTTENQEREYLMIRKILIYMFSLNLNTVVALHGAKQCQLYLEQSRLDKSKYREKVQLYSLSLKT